MAAVAMTPTARVRVASAAAVAPGRTTPRMGSAYRRRSSGRATAVEVLQATTMALTSRSASVSRHSVLNRRTSSSGRGPYGCTRVVAQVEGVFSRQATDDLAQDGQAADPGVEETDGSRVAHPGQTGVSTRAGAAAGCARLGCSRRRQALGDAHDLLAGLGLGLRQDERHAFGCRGLDQLRVVGDGDVGQSAQLGAHLLRA